MLILGRVIFGKATSMRRYIGDHCFSLNLGNEKNTYIAASVRFYICEGNIGSNF